KPKDERYSCRASALLSACFRDGASRCIQKPAARMAITEHDVELFAARIRAHFPSDQRDVAYELAYAIARVVGPKVKQLTPDTSLAEILSWWKTEEPIPTGCSGDSLDQVEWIMAMEEEFGP